VKEKSNYLFIDLYKEVIMQNKKGVFIISKRRLFLMFIISVIVLVSAACSGTVNNSSTPTPTTVMGFIPPEQQQTSVPTQNSSSLPVASTPLDETNVCSLATSEEASAVLGQSVIAATPGSEPDDVTGTTLYFCTYLGSGLAIVVSTVDTGSAQAGSTMLQSQLAKMLADDPSLTTTDETGIGDRLVYAVAEHAISYTVLKGSRVFSVALGGNVGDLASHKAALLTLTQSIASKQ
jgi:hypothetical protein